MSSSSGDEACDFPCCCFGSGKQYKENRGSSPSYHNMGQEHRADGGQVHDAVRRQQHDAGRGQTHGAGRGQAHGAGRGQFSDAVTQQPRPDGQRRGNDGAGRGNDRERRGIDPQIIRLNERVDVIEREKLSLQQTHQRKLQEIDELQRTNRSQQKSISDLQKENGELRTRLSSVISTNVTNENPNIADLSDMNRPTKLAEQYSELYDNDWTDTFDEIIKQGTPGKEAIAAILGLFLKINSLCKTEASKNLTGLEETVGNFIVGQQKMRYLKQLKEARKKNFKEHVAKITPDIRKTLKKDGKFDAHLTGSAGNFIDKSIKLCWLMAIQDPPVYVEDQVTGLPGQEFDTKLYKHYTKSGKYVDFVVWPTLWLSHGGQILSKGVAQAINRP